MDLDPVELVVESAIAAAGRDQARSALSQRRCRAGGKRATGAAGQGIPLGKGRAAGRRIRGGRRDREQLQLADGPGAHRRVGAAERALADVRIVERGTRRCQTSR